MLLILLNYGKRIVILRKELLDAGEELKIPGEIAIKYLYDAFQMIDGLKKLLQEKSYMVEQMNLNNESMEKIKGPLRELSVQFLLDDTISPQEAAITLKRKLKVEVEKQIQFKEKSNQLTKLQEELAENQVELNRVIDEMRTLFSIVSVQDEDHFREKGKNAALRAELWTKWNSLSIQLKLSSFSKEEAEKLSSIESQEFTLQKIIDQKEKRNVELSQLLDDLASMKYNIQLLEMGDYAELLHHFKQLKSEFETEAYEWARFATAKEILQKTVNNFKTETCYQKCYIRQRSICHF